MKRVFALLLCVLFLLPVGCTPQLGRYTETRYEFFDTVTVLTGYAATEAAFMETAERVFSELRTLHALFDIYHDATMPNLKTINDNAGGTPVRVDARIIDLLQFGREVDILTDHRVDITLGAVLSLWHDARTAALDSPETAVLPSEEALKAAARHTGFDRLEIDEAAGTVRLTDPEARLDVGAIAKGYAAKCAEGILPDGYLLSLGGNVVVKGTKPGNEQWTVGIQDPFDAATLLLTIRAENCSVVTSGDYQRVFTLNGIRYHHIIDPETLFPATGWSSVTVVCDDSALADALSTALFLMDRTEGSRLVEACGAEALWIDPDGVRYATESFSLRMP